MFTLTELLFNKLADKDKDKDKKGNDDKSVKTPGEAHPSTSCTPICPFIPLSNTLHPLKTITHT